MSNFGFYPVGVGQLIDIRQSKPKAQAYRNRNGFARDLNAGLEQSPQAQRVGDLQQVLVFPKDSGIVPPIPASRAHSRREQKT
jgi:hypothetical protein